MALRVVPRAYSRQPQEFALLDSSNPLAQNLGMFYPLGGGWLLNDATGRTKISSVAAGPILFSNQSFGTAVSFNGTTQYLTTNSNGILGSGAITFFCLFQTTTAGNLYIVSWGSASSAGTAFQVSVESGVIWGRFSGGVTAYAGSGYNDGKVHFLVMVKPPNVSSSGVLVFVDGEQLSTTTAGTATINVASSQPVRFGTNVAVVITGPGSVALAGISSEVWGSNHVNAFQKNPWQLFLEDVYEWYTVTGTIITLDASFACSWLSKAQADWQMPVESISNLQLDRALDLEFLSQISRDAPIPVDSMVSIEKDSQFDGEWTTGISRDTQVNLESLRSVQSDTVFQVEHLASVLSDFPVPVEWSGSIAVTLDAAFPLEWGAKMQTDAVIPVEWTGSLTVHMDASFPFECGASVQRDFQIPVEHIASFLTTRQVSLDFAASIARDFNLQGCWLRVVELDADMAASWETSISANGVMPIEWGGAATNVFDTGVVHVFRVDARGTVFRISPRSAVFKIND